MARSRRGTMANLVAAILVALALVGGWTVWQWHETRSAVDHVERAVKAAHQAW
jgi:hypothetical protein